MITQTDLKELEKYLDSVWGLLGIDIQFTRHFLERANDPRNGKEIEFEELRKLFIETYKRYGPAFVKMGKKDAEIEGVLTSASTKLNSPFVLKWDQKDKEFDLVGKTVMRKANFVPNNNKEKKYTVESTNMTNLFNKFQVPADFAADANKILEQNYADKKAMQQETVERNNTRGKELLGLKEDVEQIDELSGSTLGSYKTKSKSGLNFAQQHKDQKTIDKRKKGLSIANKKFLNSGWSPPKTKSEEVEPLDELSKATLGSYVKKASHDVATKSAATGRYGDRARNAEDKSKAGDHSGWQQGRKDSETADKFFKKSWKRREGMAKAVDKLAKEDVEQIDEISKDTLDSYTKKATDSKNNAYRKHSLASKMRDKNGVNKNLNTIFKREKGLEQAKDRLNKEDVQLDELSGMKKLGYSIRAGLDHRKRVKDLRPQKDDMYDKSEKYYDHVLRTPNRDSSKDKELETAKDDSNNKYHDNLRKVVNRNKYGMRAKGLDTDKWFKNRTIMPPAYKKPVKEDVDQLDESDKPMVISSANKKAAILKQRMELKLKRQREDDTKREADARKKQGENFAEDVDQLDELSPATLHSYKAKADMNMHYNKGMADQHSESGSKEGVKHYNKAISRQKGIHKADEKIAQHADKPQGVIGKIRAKVKGIAADVHHATSSRPLPDKLKTNVQKAKEKRSYFEDKE